MNVEINAPVALVEKFKHKIEVYAEASKRGVKDAAHHACRNLAFKLVKETSKIAPSNELLDSLPATRNWKIGERLNGVVHRTIPASDKDRVMKIIAIRKKHRHALMGGWIGCTKVLLDRDLRSGGDDHHGTVNVSINGVFGFAVSLKNHRSWAKEVSAAHGCTEKAMQATLEDMDIYIRRKMGEVVHDAAEA